MNRRLFGGARSLTTQLVGLVMLLQLAITGGLLGYVGWSAGQQLRADQQAYVTELKDNLADIYAAEGREGLVRLIDRRLGTGAWTDSVVLLEGSDGTPIAGNLRAWPPTIPTEADWREVDLYRAKASAPDRIGLTATRLSGGERLLTGWVLDDDLRLRRSLGTAILAALLFSVPLALASAMVLARLLTARLEAVSETTMAVADGDLARRVPRDGSRDAFDDLAMRVNAMLDRVELLVKELRTVTDGLAHDLRSPVTRLQSRLEQAVAASHAHDREGALQGAQQELGQLLRMLTTALQISRAETGLDAVRMERADIADLLSDVAELYEPVCEDAGFALTLHTRAGLSADINRELLVQALANLIENALKYATGGNRIELAGAVVADALHLSVRDNGLGIPADLRDEARKRFVRLDPARSKPGSGLGLALADAVAVLHGGSMQLGDAGPGLVVTLILPRNG